MGLFELTRSAGTRTVRRFPIPRQFQLLIIITSGGAAEQPSIPNFLPKSYPTTLLPALRASASCHCPTHQVRVPPFRSQHYYTRDTSVHVVTGWPNSMPCTMQRFGFVYYSVVRGKVIVSRALGESGMCVGHGILGWVVVITLIILFDGTVDFVAQTDFFFF